MRLSKFENERVISFIPPDGEFQFLSYRLELPLSPLFVVGRITFFYLNLNLFLEVLLDIKRTSISYIIKAKSNYKSECVA